MSARPRSVFFGTPDFTLPLLEATAKVTELVAVVTQPDRPKGRGQALVAPPAKAWALARGLSVLQPEKLRDGKLAAELRPLALDVAVVAAYGRILPKELLELPRAGCVNVHASLLPKYRGAAPIQWAIAQGEAETGVALMRMDEGLDTGDVIFVKRLSIAGDDTAGSLFAKLASLGGELIEEALPRYLAGELQASPQAHEQATLAPILTKADGRLDFEKSAAPLERQVRAFDPWPGAHTLLHGEPLKVLRARVAALPGRALPGTIVSVRPLVVAAGEETALELVEVQPAGRKRMSGAELASGRRLVVGERLDADPA